MGKPARGPADIQRSLVQQVQSIANHTRGISEDLAGMTKGLQDGMQTSTDPTGELLSATAQLSASALQASRSLSDCLNDLVSMGEAMTPVLDSNTEAAPALLLNFFSTFVTQMNNFYAEMNADWVRGTQIFARGKAAFYREPSPGTPRAALPTPAVTATTGTAATLGSTRALSPRQSPLSPVEDTAVAARPARHKKHAALEDAVGEDGALASNTADGLAPRKKPGKKKRATLTPAAEPVDEEDVDAQGEKMDVMVQNLEGDTPLQDNGRSRSPAQQPMKTSDSRSEDRMAVLAAAAESGVRTAGSRRGKMAQVTPDSLEASQNAAAPVSAAELDAVAAAEPEYLTVTSTVEAALGPMVMGSRPNVFSNVTTFTYEEPVSTYYIHLARPGSLAHFIVVNYVNRDEETQADFLCDVLDTDCAEVDPFATPSGEVTVANEDDLQSLPPCAWSVGSSEDNARRLYTMYVLMRQPPRLGPTALVMESLNMDGTREEVLQMITVVDAAPQYAKVTCMMHGYGEGQKPAAILSFARSMFAQAGFSEAAESEVKSALSRMRPSRSPGAELLRARDRSSTATTFKPPVQLASLDRPAADAGISFGGVARGAMQGGMEVLKAPFTVGRAVGGALLDVTGVSEAVRNNLEGLFRKSFPELSAETIIESFNCAWAKRGSLTQGYVFITTHWLCFQAAVSSAKFSIEYDEIKDIIKSKSVKMFENALEIKTHLNDTIFLTSFLQRDQAYNALMKEWLKQ